MQAERRVLEAKREFVHVLRLTKEKIARSEKERIEDFKDALHAFLEGMIERQKEVCACDLRSPFALSPFILPNCKSCSQCN